MALFLRDKPFVFPDVADTSVIFQRTGNMKGFRLLQLQNYNGLEEWRNTEVTDGKCPMTTRDRLKVHKNVWLWEGDPLDTAEMMVFALVHPGQFLTSFQFDMTINCTLPVPQPFRCGKPRPCFGADLFRRTGQTSNAWGRWSPTETLSLSGVDFSTRVLRAGRGHSKICL